MRQRHPLGPFQQLDHLIVNRRANQLDNFVAGGPVERLAAGEGLGLFGAPPAEVFAPCSPVAAFPLSQP